MFERRVKIFLSVLVLATLVLLARVMQIQVLGQGYWDEQAVKIMSSGELVETVRGRLLDRNRNPMAVDAPCIDAAVDYRAILFEPEPKWVAEVATKRVRQRLGDAYLGTPRVQRLAMIDQEKEAVVGDIRIMWDRLSDLGGQTRDEMDELRRSIIRKVELRRRKVWYSAYEKAMPKEGATTQPSAWYERWLLDESQDIPEVDAYFKQIAEESEPHVILPDVTNATNNYLGKNGDHFPGLTLRASVHRTYPYADVAAHVIGHLGRVAREDLTYDPHRFDELRGYELNDLVGREGLESLCEELLRGTRGKIEKYFADAPREVRVSEPVPGRDVLVTLDMELQRKIQAIFRKVELTYKETGQAAEKENLEMPGAAVLLDVKTNQVLALVSYPSFNANEYDRRYLEWVRDEINRPLINRATMFALEPGSTVKPIVGLGAMTQGLFGVNETVECTGYLQLGGKTFLTQARCWVASNFFTQLGGNVAHHPIPSDDPHPTGHLTFPDALQRSCNVFFETIADRLHVDGLRYWYQQFGLGLPTGIGIKESAGMVPLDLYIPPERMRNAAWFSGIGQDQVLATPIQMANVAATIARNGIWMRPRLLLNEDDNPQTPADRGPDSVDLKLLPEALAEARAGMVKVVNTRAGTGTSMRLEHLTVAGKTGSAQAGALQIRVRDADGKVVDRKPLLPLGTHEQPNPDAPWYRGWGTNEDRRSHAWVIGFVPAEDPKVAFAVMVEYGGGGGATAGWVAHKMLEACIELGYLPKGRSKE